MSDSPPSYAVDRALETAAFSLCQSKLGVVTYYQSAVEDVTRCTLIIGTGFNGPPAPFACPGREHCSGTCGKRCVHAEMRALRSPPPNSAIKLELVHVELGSDGRTAVCAGPSCWQCSREILDIGFIGGVWLYENDVLLAGDPPLRGPAWCRYTAENFHRVTLANAGLEP